MKKIYVLLTLLIFSCHPPEPVDPADDKVEPVEEVDDCKAGCDRIRELKCTEILEELNEETGSCEEACAQIIEAGSNLGVEAWKDHDSCDNF